MGVAVWNGVGVFVQASGRLGKSEVALGNGVGVEVGSKVKEGTGVGGRSGAGTQPGLKKMAR